MQIHASFVVLALSLSGAACGGAKSPQPTPPAPATQPAHEGGMAAMCPMKVPGTQVSASDTAEGVAIAFSTSGDVAQLRERVHHMAAMHEEMMSGGTMGSKGMMGSGATAGSGGMMGSGGMGSGSMMKMVPSKARVEDIDGGARIVLTPNDPAQLAELRDHVHHHAEMMKHDGECPMMHGGA